MQKELAVTIDGIHRRLSLLRGGNGGQGQEAAAAARLTATASPPSSSSQPPREEQVAEKQPPEGDQADDDDGSDGDDVGGAGGRPKGANDPPDDPCASRSRPPFAAGDTCLAPRVFDRRRARAVVEEVLPGGSGACLVTWLHPRQRGELVCRYWKEVRWWEDGLERCVNVFRRRCCGLLLCAERP